MKKFLFLATLLLTPIPFGYPLTAASTQQQGAVHDFRAVAKKAIPSVVSIKVRNGATEWRRGLTDDDDEGDLFGDPFLFRFFGFPKEPRATPRTPYQGQASGVIYSSDGLVLTNNHVVNNASEITVALNDGREFKATVVGRDPNTDIALLKIEATDLPALALGDSDALEVGQPVAAIGNPMGLQASMSAGIVSAKGRNNLDITPFEDFIQTDAAINRGNSGGPLVNLDGEIVGLNTAIVTSGGTTGYMGIGFAIPSNIIGHIVKQLLTNGNVTRGYLGVTMQNVDNDLAQALGLKKIGGALVTEVMKDSPAEKSGVKQGDVIVKYGEQSVTNIAGLRNAVAMMSPGAKLMLTVQRDGKELKIPVDVGTFPAAYNEPAQSADQLGFNVKALTPEIAQKYGYREDQGVVITEVATGSPASWAGLKAGALILQINRQPINSLDDYKRAMSHIEKGQPILLLVKQGNVVRYLSLRLG